MIRGRCRDNYNLFGRNSKFIELYDFFDSDDNIPKIGINLSIAEEANGLSLLTDLLTRDGTSTKYKAPPDPNNTPVWPDKCILNDIDPSSVNAVRIPFQGKDSDQFINNLFSNTYDEFINTTAPENVMSNSPTLTQQTGITGTDGSISYKSGDAFELLFNWILIVSRVFKTAIIILDSHCYGSYVPNEGSGGDFNNIPTNTTVLWANILTYLKKQADKSGDKDEWEKLFTDGRIYYELLNEPYNLRDITQYQETIEWIKRSEDNGVYSMPKILLGIDANAPNGEHFSTMDETTQNIIGISSFTDWVKSNGYNLSDFAYAPHQYMNKNSTGTVESITVDDNTVSSMNDGIKDYAFNLGMDIMVTEVGCAGVDDDWTVAWKDMWTNCINSSGGNTSGEGQFLGATIWVCDMYAAWKGLSPNPATTDFTQELNNINKKQLESVYVDGDGTPLITTTS